MLRTHFAGELNAAAIGQTVTLAGWVARRRDHGGVIFVDLRDSSGIAQVVFRKADVAEQAHHLRSEYCIKVTGVVEARPEESIVPGTVFTVEPGIYLPDRGGVRIENTYVLEEDGNVRSLQALSAELLLV